jgi:hypothetical protein
VYVPGLFIPYHLDRGFFMLCFSRFSCYQVHMASEGIV